MKHLRPISLLAGLVLMTGLFFCRMVPGHAQAVVGPTGVSLHSFRPSAAADITITQGDTGPILDAVLTGAGGVPVDLTGATVTVTANAGRGHNDQISGAACTITDPPNGHIAYAWQTSDTAVAGTFNLTFQAVLQDGTTVTFPSGNALRMSVTPVTHYAQSGSSPPGGTTPPVIYTTNSIAPDGAFGTNAQYENKQVGYYLPELQKYGTDWVEQGITEENPALISKGLLMLDWGFSKEASDGSFPGAGSIPITPTNATSATGGVFHTTSLFFEAANRAVLDLRAYHPITYTLDPSTYSDKLASYATQLHQIALWLTNTSWTPPGASAPVNVPQLGYNTDQYYTHRFGLLGAGLQECAVVTGDASLTPLANGWLDQLFPKQFGAGYQAAIPTAALTTPTPAVILPPGVTTIPPNTAYTIPAVGVLPERGGYDVSYGMVDCLHQTRYYNASTDTVRKAEIKTALIAYLSWERSRQATSGAIDSTGSTRVGIDPTLQVSGNTKGIATGEVLQAFLFGGAIDGKGRDVLGGIRFRDVNTLPNSDPIAASGAIGGNSAYDNDNTQPINISSQKDGADWVQAGVLHENDAQIMQGTAILNWGLGAQANDGSFPNTGSRYTDTAYFLEALARATLMIENYHPISHTAGLGITSLVPSYVTAIDLTANYLTTPSLVSSGYVSTTSASKIMTYAAALGEAAVACATAYPADAAKFQTQANLFLAAALALQLTDGTFGETGTFAGNSQATSCLMADRLAQYGTFTTPSQATLLTAISSGLTKMETVVNVDGSFTISSPATVTTQYAFQQGASVTGNQAFNVIYHRIVDPTLPGQ